MRSRPFAIVLLLITCLAGCSTPAHQASSTPTPPHGPTTAPIRLGKTVTALALGPDRVAFADRTGSSGNDALFVLAGAHHTRHEIAASKFSPGRISSVAQVGSWIVYVDQQDCRCAGPGEVRWRVRAVNATSGKHRLLASSGQRRDPRVPTLSARGGVVDWEVFTSQHAHRDFAWTPSWPHPSGTPSWIPPGSVVLTDHSTIYRFNGDCYARRGGKGDPAPLTSSGLVESCDSDGTWVTWTNRVVDQGDPENGGQTSTVYETWRRSFGGGPPVLVRSGPGAVDINLHSGWAAWADNRAVYARRLEDPRVRISLPIRSVIRVAVFGHEVVAVTQDACGTCLRAARIGVGGSRGSAGAAESG